MDDDKKDVKMKRQFALLALIIMAFFRFTMGIAEAQELDIQAMEQNNAVQTADDSAYPNRLIDVSIGASVQLFSGYLPASVNADVRVQYRFNAWYRLGVRWNVDSAGNLKGDLTPTAHIESLCGDDADYDAFYTSFILVNEFDVYHGNIYSASRLHRKLTIA